MDHLIYLKQFNLEQLNEEDPRSEVNIDVAGDGTNPSLTRTTLQFLKVQETTTEPRSCKWY